MKELSELLTQLTELVKQLTELIEDIEYIAIKRAKNLLSKVKQKSSKK